MMEHETKEIRLPRDVVLANRHKFKEQGNALLDEGFNVRFNLLDCSFLDSSALGMLVTLSKRARRLGQRISLVNVNEDLKTLLRLTKLTPDEITVED